MQPLWQMAGADWCRRARWMADRWQTAQASEPLRAATPLLLLHLNCHRVVVLRKPLPRPSHQHNLLEA